MEAAASKKYELVASRVERLVRSGALRSGEKIPSVRDMAEQMRVSVMTVLEGYRLLEDRGLIESRPQSGYYVRPPLLRAPLAHVELPRAGMEPIRVFTSQVRIGEAVERLIMDSQGGGMVPLGAGFPAPEYLPGVQLGLRLARAVRRDPDGMNRYSTGMGDEGLRRALSVRMIEAGVEADPNGIVVTSGATQALLLALRAVCAPGDTVAVESPGYFGFYALLNFLSLRAAEIPGDAETGFSVDAFERLVRRGTRVACVLLSANFANPTGAVMPDDQKRRLAGVCAGLKIPVIEDDIYGDLAYGARPPALKAYNPEGVIYVSSMSKVLAPGYRIGWVAGGRHHRDVLRCHGMAVLSVPLPNQTAVAMYLRDGGMRSHLRALRKRYAENMALFRNAVARFFPEGTGTGNPGGGHFLWVRLPSGADSRDIAAAAFERGISVAPGVIFTSREHYTNYIRICTALPWTRKVEGAMKTLGELAGR